MSSHYLSKTNNELLFLCVMADCINTDESVRSEHLSRIEQSETLKHKVQFAFLNTEFRLFFLHLYVLNYMIWFQLFTSSQEYCISCH